MASEVDICNQALSLLGDEASVASIDPPEQSVQAMHCARFYPMARNSLLEMHDWNFATRRGALAELTNDRTDWAHCYAWPNKALRVMAVCAADVPDDRLDDAHSRFVVEMWPDGQRVIYTEQEDAHARYTFEAADPTKFSPLFVEALATLLASKLAGPLIKGGEGRQVAAAMLEAFYNVVLHRAVASDANQRRLKPEHVADWISGR